MNFQLHPIQEKDLPELQQLALQTFIATYAHLNDPDNFQLYLDAHFSPAQIRKEWEHPNSYFFQVLHQQQMVAYTKLNLGDAQTDLKDKKGVEVERIYVRKAYQGQQLGRLMIDKAKSFTQEQGLDFVWLGVWEENPKAIRFYEKMGFNIFDTHIFQMGDDPQTDFLMRFDLK